MSYHANRHYLRATTATNTFAEDRVRAEELATEAAQKATDEQIAEIEKQAEADRKAVEEAADDREVGA